MDGFCGTGRRSLASKAARLRRILRELGQVGVAFSGGVDSALLLQAALEELGPENVIVLHARSCLQKEKERARADSWLERHGHAALAVRQRTCDLQPLAWQDFVGNPPSRCYLCKRRIYGMFLEELAREGVSALLDGTNFDDRQQREEGRPGLRAVAELGVRTPLADCCLTKTEVRQLSRSLRLDTWNQPSSSCLATRIPHGMEITTERLERIEAWEQAAEDLGFSGCRARMADGGRTIRLQLLKEDVDRFCVPAVRQRACGLLKSKGADKILLDLDGR